MNQPPGGGQPPGFQGGGFPPLPPGGQPQQGQQGGQTVPQPGHPAGQTVPQHGQHQGAPGQGGAGQQGGFGQQPGQQGGFAQQQPGAGSTQPGSTSSPFGGMGGVGGGDKAAKAKGFLKSLVDFSFTNETFVSPRVLKILYGFHLFMLVPMTLFLLFVWYQALTHERYEFDTGETSWDPEFGLFCGATVMFPIIAFLWVLFGRVMFERMILAFRQHSVTQELLDLVKSRGGS